MAARKYRQFQLQSGNTRTSCWLEDDPRLKVGNSVTLKTSEDPNRWWVIKERGETLKEMSQINQKWNVGGLHG